MLFLQKSDIFTSSVYQNNLLVDTGFQDCGKGTTVTFSVEKTATLVELLTLASDTSAIVKLTDGNS